MLFKRGQTSIYITIGIIILILCILLFYLREYYVNKELEAQKEAAATLPTKVQEVSDYVSSCLTETAKSVILTTGLNGGFYESLETDYNYSYILDDKENIPTTKDLSDQLNKGMINEAVGCTNFSSFPYDISYNLDSIKVESRMNEKLVQMSIKFPIKVIIAQSTYNLQDFNININTNYYKFYKIAVELTKEQETNLNEFCISCVSDIAEKYNITINDMESQDENNYIITYYLNVDNNDDPLLTYSFSHKLVVEE